MRHFGLLFFGDFVDLLDMRLPLRNLLLPATRIRATSIITANLRVVIHLRDVIVGRPSSQILDHVTHFCRIPVVHEVAPVAAAFVARLVF